MQEDGAWCARAMGEVVELDEIAVGRGERFLLELEPVIAPE